MNFGDVIEWNIPEGSVEEVRETETGRVIWQGMISAIYHDYDQQSNVTYYANYSQNIIYKINIFGCNPILKTYEDGVEIDSHNAVNGDSIHIVNPPHIDIEKYIKIQFTNIDSNSIVYINGNKIDGFKYQFKFEPGIIVNIFIMNQSYNMNYMADEYHTPQFIASPGNLIGGLRYKIKIQSLYSGDLNGVPNGYGRVRFGHDSTATSHKMHLSFAYIDNGITIHPQLSFINGVEKTSPSKPYTGYFNDDDMKTMYNATSANNIHWIGVSGSNRNTTTVDLKDIEIDLRTRQSFEQFQFGIILLDNSPDCSGLRFGYDKNNGTSISISTY